MSEQDSKPPNWPIDDPGTRSQAYEPPFYEDPQLPDGQQPWEPPFHEPDPPPPAPEERE